MTSVPLRLWLLAGLLLPWMALADESRPLPGPAPRVDRAGDPLPRCARARLGSLRYQHGSQVTSLCYLPGGKQLASFGQDRVIRVWDHDTGRELRHIDVPGPWVLSEDKRFAAIFYEHDPFQIVDLTGADEPRDIANVSFASEQIMTAFSPDGQILAVVQSDVGRKKVGPLRLWEVATGKELPGFALSSPAKKGDTPAADMAFLASLVFSPDGRTLAAVCQSQTQGGHLRLWDVQTGKALPAPAGQHSSQVLFCADSKTFLAVNVLNEGGMAVVQWETATGKKVREFGQFQDTEVCLRISPDGKVLAAMEVGNGGARLWDLDTGKERKAPSFGAGGVLFAIAFSPDSRTLALVYEDNDLRIGLWDVVAGKEVRDIKAAVGDFFSSFLPPGDFELGGPLVFTSDGKELATAGSSGVHRWDPSSGKELYAGEAPPRGQVTRLTVSPDGKQVVTTNADQVVRLWDVAAGKELRRLPPPAEVEYPQASEAAFAPDGRLFAVGWYDGQIQLWDLTTGKELRVLKGHAGMVCSLAFAPNGKTLASADYDGDVIWWDVAKGRELRRFAEAPLSPNLNEAPVRPAGAPRVAFAADGKVLAALIFNRNDYRARIWELASGAVRRDIEVKSPLSESPQGAIDGGQNATCLKLSPDGKTLLWLAGASIHFWDLVHDKEIRTLDPAGELMDEIVFSPDGRWVAGAGRSGSVRLWEAATGALVVRLTGHRGSVASLAFSGDGQSLFSGGSDGTVLIWDVPAALVNTALSKDSNVDWDALGERDAKRAYQAIGRLVSRPRESVAWISEHLKPVAPADPARLARLIADLESDRFTVRHRATLDLEKLGDLAEAALRKRLADHPSLEVTQRLEKVLERVTGPLSDSEKLRAIRALEVLEHIGTPEAQAILRDVARGTPEARLTREAKEALQRLTNPR